MKRDDILLNEIYHKEVLKQKQLNENIFKNAKDKLTSFFRKPQETNKSTDDDLGALKEILKKKGMSEQEIDDFINTKLNVQNQPSSEMSSSSEVSRVEPFSAIENEDDLKYAPKDINVTPVNIQTQPQTTNTAPLKKPNLIPSTPKRKQPESKYYFVPNKFVENNPPKVGQDYVSIPNVMEYLGITPKEYTELSKIGYLGIKRIEGVPYVRKDLIEGKNYHDIMVYLNDKDMEEKKAQEAEKNKKLQVKKPSVVKKSSTSKKSTVAKKPTKKP